MTTTEQLLDILMKGYKKPEDLIGENGLLKSQILSQTLERCKGNKSQAAHMLKISRKMFYHD
jgi:DNA-binding NtrC family response regulator